MQSNTAARRRQLVAGGILALSALLAIACSDDVTSPERREPSAPLFNWQMEAIARGDTAAYDIFAYPTLTMRYGSKRAWDIKSLYDTSSTASDGDSAHVWVFTEIKGYDEFDYRAHLEGDVTWSNTFFADQFAYVACSDDDGDGDCIEHAAAGTPMCMETEWSVEILSWHWAKTHSGTRVGDQRMYSKEWQCQLPP